MTNLQIYVFAALALAGSVSTAVAQDAALGEKVFQKCKACHQIGEGAKDAVGPVLNGVVGRKAGTYPDYAYSDANKNSGITWDEATLKEYLEESSRQGSRHQDALPWFDQGVGHRQCHRLSQAIRARRQKVLNRIARDFSIQDTVLRRDSVPALCAVPGLAATA